MGDFIGNLFGRSVSILIAMGCAFLCMCAMCCAATNFVAGALQDASENSQESLIAINSGRGSQENPILRGTAAQFENFSVLPVSLSRPATQQVRDLTTIYEPPAAGTDYVLMRVRLTCLRTDSTVCRGRDFNIRLVDAAGNEWGEPGIIVPQDWLDTQEAVGGASIEGWQVFEFPQNGAIQSIRMWTNTEGSLYALPPSG